MRYMKWTVFCFLLSFSAFATVFTHPTRGFHFEYNAADWEIVPDVPAKGADVDKKMAERTLVTLQRKVPDEKYRARFSVVVDDVAKAKGKNPSALARYEAYATEFLKGQRFTISSAETKKLSALGVEAAEITAYQRDFGLTFRQVIFLKGSEAYLLTGAARTKSFEAHSKEIQGMIDSFQFGPAQN